MILIHSLWNHTKTGNLYEVLDVVINATNAQNGEEMVLYHRTELGLRRQRYVRTRAEFMDRFTLVSDPQDGEGAE